MTALTLKTLSNTYMVHLLAIMFTERTSVIKKINNNGINTEKHDETLEVIFLYLFSSSNDNVDQNEYSSSTNLELFLLWCINFFL